MKLTVSLLSVLTLGLLGSPVPAGNLVLNGGFERGRIGWTDSWATGRAPVVRDERRSRRGRGCLVISAEGGNVGADGRDIYVDLDFDPTQRQRLSAWVFNEGITQGGFGLRFYALDAGGKTLTMKSLGNVGPSSPEGRWKHVAAEVGPGTSLAFPARTDHVMIRFSFWSPDGRCRGRVRVDDVSFAPAEDEPQAAKHPANRTGKGAVAVWRDDVPVVGVASAPRRIASCLRSAGYGVNRLSTDELAHPGILRAGAYDLLILPHGEVYPAAGATALRRYLRSGGHLIALGGRCLRQPIYPSTDGWTLNPTDARRDGSTRPMLELTEQRVSELAKRMARGGQPAEVSCCTDDTGRPALRVLVPELRTYTYARFSTRGAADETVVAFRARGLAGTPHLCVEVNEQDGSRWKAVVPLTEAWKDYTLSLGSFVAYASPQRGGPGDVPDAAKIRRVGFGFPTSLVGQGQRGFELSQVAWRTGTVDPQEVARGSLTYQAPSALVRAFGSELRLRRQHGAVTAFVGSRRVDSAAWLRPDPDQNVFSSALTIDGPVSGWTATVLETDAYEPAGRDRPGEFLPTVRYARSIPLLRTPSGEPLAALFLHVQGTFAPGRWACFGVTDRDLFEPGNETWDRAFATLVDRMIGGTFVEALRPGFDVHDGRVRMRLRATLTSMAGRRQKVTLRTRLMPTSGRVALAEREVAVDLAPGESREVIALSAATDAFDWRAFRAVCDLVIDGERVDRIGTTVDVRDTLLAVCDRLVATQQERGDGKFSGVAFVDNRGARGLLAAYDITDRKAYLDAAVSWGEAMLAEQRPDGGYLMGYGYHADGNECFVADGGEIACGVARLIAYVPEDQARRFSQSLRDYMRYRESFRCEGGGIGVGWCRRDYGARPIKPLDKITKIYAPERNIYTIGCTLAAATMHARLTGDPQDNDAAVRDAHWWLERCTSTKGGAFVESAVWAHRYLTGGGIRQATESFLLERFLPHVVPASSHWWTGGGGRTVQGLEGLSYVHHRIEQRADVLATLMRATYHLCSPEALSGLPRLLEKEAFSSDEWRYIEFAAVSLPNLIVPEITRKGF